MTTLIKSIKPQRFNEEALRREFRNALKRVGRVVKNDYEAIVANWDNKPTFKVSTHVTKRLPSPSVEVWTTDTPFVWVNMGTAGRRRGTGQTYEIWAGVYTGKSDKTTLAFPSAFTPKTQPGSLESGSGSSGGEMAFAPMVNHPGVRPRRFDKQIKQKREKWRRR